MCNILHARVTLINRPRFVCTVNNSALLVERIGPYYVSRDVTPYLLVKLYTHFKPLDGGSRNLRNIMTVVAVCTVSRIVRLTFTVIAVRYCDRTP